MIEHRLIERMLSLVKDALVHIGSTHKVDPLFVDIVVDFVRMYADRTHHGKEEDQAMLAEFWEFDRKMIHEKYKSVVEELEKR